MSKYYLVQVDNEYMRDNEGGYTTLKTKAARIRKEDLFIMRYLLKDYHVKAGFVPTSYKPGDTAFIDPIEWADYRHHLYTSWG